ncbi:hypothetical protein SK128_009205 [Halocaridina rubra]|uniref:Uncharacterized protein n=1 Tax=Halocaridina rubra TaxID=373956 RepID=A0AAN8XBB1_HALRR
MGHERVDKPNEGAEVDILPKVATPPFSPVISDESALSPMVHERVDKANEGAEVDILPKLATPVRRSARAVKPPDWLDL